MADEPAEKPGQEKHNENHSIRTEVAARLSLALVTVAGSIYAVAQPTQRYTVVDLGQVGPAPGQPYAIADNGLIGGEIAPTRPPVPHAALWLQGKRKDIGSPGLGGPNSSVFGTNVWGQAVGQADTK